MHYTPNTYYERAPASLRIANYFIDYFLAIWFVYFVRKLVQPEDLIPLGRFIIDTALLFVYYFCFEHFNHGKTPAKYLTKTRAVRSDGDPLTPLNTALRTLIRVIPINPLSFLPNNGETGWHDIWTKTCVVKD